MIQNISEGTTTYVAAVASKTGDYTLLGCTYVGYSTLENCIIIPQPMTTGIVYVLCMYVDPNKLSSKSVPLLSAGFAILRRLTTHKMTESEVGSVQNVHMTQPSGTHDGQLYSLIPFPDVATKHHFRTCTDSELLYMATLSQSTKNVCSVCPW